MNKISFIVGARPNFVKLFPIYKKLQNEYELSIIHTNQHFDYNMAMSFIETFNLRVINLIYDDNHNQEKRIDTMVNKIKNILINISPKLVIVFGDVDSSLAGAIAAKELNIQIVHIESGNRCFDQTMPEERNRMQIDKLATYHFISEPNGIKNLLNEKIIQKPQENITYFYVGNPMIDTVLYFKDNAMSHNFYEKLGLEKNNYILITLHRQINVDIDNNLRIIISSVEHLAKEYKIVFPLHPRTKKKILELSLSLNNIVILEPLNYINFLNLMIHASIVITDGGGIQEETTFLNIPCITLRQSTERPITCTLGTNVLIERIDKHHIIELTQKYIGRKKININIPLWDGKSSDRILQYIGQII